MGWLIKRSLHYISSTSRTQYKATTFTQTVTGNMKTESEIQMVMKTRIKAFNKKFNNVI